MNKEGFDFKIPKTVSKDTMVTNIFSYLFVLLIIFSPLYVFIDLTFIENPYDPVAKIFNAIFGTEMNNINKGIITTILVTISAPIISLILSLIPAIIIFGLSMKSNENLEKTVGDKNEAENYLKIDACSNMWCFVELINNSNIEITVGKDVENKLTSKKALDFFTQLNEKIKTTKFYKKILDDLNDTSSDLENYVHLFYYKNRFKKLNLISLFEDIESKIIDKINNSQCVSLDTLFRMEAFEKAGNSIDNEDTKLGDVIKLKAPEFINYYIINDPSHVIDTLLNIPDFEENFGQVPFVNILYPIITDEILNVTEHFNNKQIFNWAVFKYNTLSNIKIIFNDDKYVNYPHKEIIIHMMENGTDEQQEFIYKMIQDIKVKSIYEKVYELFYTNVNIALALINNSYSEEKKFTEYFDNLMTNGWNNLYLLYHLDISKFNKDMGNEKTRELKARIQELEHKNALLSHAEQTTKSAKEQADAAKNAEAYAKEQAQYQAQVAEYQRIASQQAAMQTKYQQQAARNSEIAMNASKSAQRDAKRAKENTEWRR